MSFLWIRSSSTLTDKISFCVSGGIYLYVICTCQDTIDNVGLYRFTYLFLKQSKKYSYIFVFYASYSTGIKILSYVLASQSSKKQVKISHYRRTEMTPVFIRRFFKTQNFCFTSPYFTPVRAEVKLTNEPS